jgi:hypothetical protein
VDLAPRRARDRRAAQGLQLRDRRDRRRPRNTVAGKLGPAPTDPSAAEGVRLTSQRRAVAAARSGLGKPPGPAARTAAVWAKHLLLRERGTRARRCDRGPRDRGPRHIAENGASVQRGASSSAPPHRPEPIGSLRGGRRRCKQRLLRNVRLKELPGRGCQRPSGSPQLRPSVLPTGGHLFSSPAAIGSPRDVGSRPIAAEPSGARGGAGVPGIALRSER